MTIDVGRTTEFVATSLQPAIDRDWSVRAGQLEWNVEFTIEHMAAALSKYTLYLASRSTEPIAVRIVSRVDASQRERIDAIFRVGQALANVASMTPPDTRVFHAIGLIDVEGYVAMGCLEVLVHGYDVACGLDLPFDPPTELVRPVVARLIPWIEPTWDAIVGYTRLENHDDSWTVLSVPLTEWDKTIPTR